MVDRVGQHLGNYRLVRLLGQGGFAEVYLGEHIYLDTQAAIKVLHAQLSRDDSEQFRLEAKRVAHLEHPHIVRVLDFGIEGNTPFLVMSYAPNGTLRQRHAKGVLLPLTTVVQYVKQIADALQYAHEEKFIHRDVKPENMLIGRRNEVLMSDFGIATIVHSTTSLSVQAAVGTIPYMAPEQLQEHPRPASDQYSLAVVVYEWLSGNRPFDGSFTEVVVKHLTMPPPPLREKIPTISPAVEQVVLTALAKDPKQRFATMQAFANAFEQASQVSPTQSFPSRGTLEPTERAILLNQSSTPTRLPTPPGPTPLPRTELATPANQVSSLPPTELATPSGPRSTVTSPSQPQQQSFATTPSKPVATPTTRVNLAPLGFAALAFTLFVLGGVNIGFLFSGSDFFSTFPLLLACGGFIQLIAGRQTSRAGSTFSATAFYSYGAFWLTLGFSIWQYPKSFYFLGLFLLAWTIFMFLMLLAALKSNIALKVLFAFLFLTFLSFTIGELGFVFIWIQISGYLSILTALIAAFMVWYSATHRSEFATAAKYNPVPLGLSAFALTTFVASIYYTDFFINSSFFRVLLFWLLIGLAIFYGGLVQLIAGIQALRTRNAYGAVAFCSYGAFWLIFGLGVWQHLILRWTTVGYLLVGLMILYIWVFILALKTNITQIFVSFVAFLTFLILAIGDLSSGGFGTWIQIGGWLGIIAAALAWYTALALLLSEMPGSFALPIGLRNK